MATTDPCLSVLETCWTTIEAYSDLESSVAVAQTCRSLRGAVVDADSNKLKVSHFEVDNSPFPSPDEPAARNWQTAPSRIPHYLSRSLNSIHFPSLRLLALDFPATRRRDATGHADVIDDACGSAFPTFVANLSSARNLERLRFTAGRLMAAERSGQMEASYEILAENLGRCGRLMDLEVSNLGFVRGYRDPLYSVALLRAVIPTILRGKLERLKVAIAGNPSDPIYARKLSTRGIDPAFDFFEAALSAEGLSVLELSISTSLVLFNLLVAAASIGEATRPSRLTKLRLNYEYDGAPLVDLSLAPLLDCFPECLSLESVFLNFPAECWEGEENVAALWRLLENKPSLSSVTISFSCFVDKSGRMIEAMAEGLAPIIGSKVLCNLSVFGLRAVGGEEMSLLQKSLRASGMMCDKFQVRNNRGGKYDVMIMNNRKLMEGESVRDVKDEFEEFQWVLLQEQRIL